MATHNNWGITEESSLPRQLTVNNSSIGQTQFQNNSQSTNDSARTDKKQSIQPELFVVDVDLTKNSNSTETPAITESLSKPSEQKQEKDSSKGNPQIVENTRKVYSHPTYQAFQKHLLQYNNVTDFIISRTEYIQQLEDALIASKNKLKEATQNLDRKKEIFNENDRLLHQLQEQLMSNSKIAMSNPSDAMDTGENSSSSYIKQTATRTADATEIAKLLEDARIQMFNANSEYMQCLDKLGNIADRLEHAQLAQEKDKKRLADLTSKCNWFLKQQDEAYVKFITITEESTKMKRSVDVLESMFDYCRRKLNSSIYNLDLFTTFSTFMEDAPFLNGLQTSDPALYNKILTLPKLKDEILDNFLNYIALTEKLIQLAGDLDAQFAPILASFTEPLGCVVNEESLEKIIKMRDQLQNLQYCLTDSIQSITARLDTIKDNYFEKTPTKTKTDIEHSFPSFSLKNLMAGHFDSLLDANAKSPSNSPPNKNEGDAIMQREISNQSTTSTLGFDILKATTKTSNILTRLKTAYTTWNQKKTKTEAHNQALSSYTLPPSATFQAVKKQTKQTTSPIHPHTPTFSTTPIQLEPEEPLHEKLQQQEQEDPFKLSKSVQFDVEYYNLQTSTNKRPSYHAVILGEIQFSNHPLDFDNTLHKPVPKRPNDLYLSSAAQKLTQGQEKTSSNTSNPGNLSPSSSGQQKPASKPSNDIKKRTQIKRAR